MHVKLQASHCQDGFFFFFSCEANMAGVVEGERESFRCGCDEATCEVWVAKFNFRESFLIFCREKFVFLLIDLKTTVTELCRSEIFDLA